MQGSKLDFLEHPVLFDALMPLRRDAEAAMPTGVGNLSGLGMHGNGLHVQTLHVVNRPDREAVLRGQRDAVRKALGMEGTHHLHFSAIYIRAEESRVVAAEDAGFVASGEHCNFSIAGSEQPQIQRLHAQSKPFARPEREPSVAFRGSPREGPGEKLPVPQGDEQMHHTAQPGDQDTPRLHVSADVLRVHLLEALQGKNPHAELVPGPQGNDPPAPTSVAVLDVHDILSILGNDSDADAADLMLERQVPPPDELPFVSHLKVHHLSAFERDHDSLRVARRDRDAKPLRRRPRVAHVSSAIGYHLDDGRRDVDPPIPAHVARVQGADGCLREARNGRFAHHLSIDSQAARLVEERKDQDFVEHGVIASA
mmetsp:Transcript_9372/g.35093  ORF Transcript_9372/g.35093 Transcript_9372/m.35093 type:complete len:368 (+) Transcript_9372:1478-2581(+)|eukprot:scaffold1858_cov261-Pinguiococcus_pyrenoidosus.AAC.1